MLETIARLFIHRKQNKNRNLIFGNSQIEWWSVSTNDERTHTLDGEQREHTICILDSGSRLPQHQRHTKPITMDGGYINEGKANDNNWFFFTRTDCVRFAKYHKYKYGAIFHTLLLLAIYFSIHFVCSKRFAELFDSIQFPTAQVYILLTSSYRSL